MTKQQWVIMWDTYGHVKTSKIQDAEKLPTMDGYINRTAIIAEGQYLIHINSNHGTGINEQDTFVADGVNDELRKALTDISEYDDISDGFGYGGPTCLPHGFFKYGGEIRIIRWDGKVVFRPDVRNRIESLFSSGKTYDHHRRVVENSDLVRKIRDNICKALEWIRNNLQCIDSSIIYTPYNDSPIFEELEQNSIDKIKAYPIGNQIVQYPIGWHRFGHCTKFKTRRERIQYTWNDPNGYGRLCMTYTPFEQDYYDETRLSKIKLAIVINENVDHDLVCSIKSNNCLKTLNVDETCFISFEFEDDDEIELLVYLGL